MTDNIESVYAERREKILEPVSRRLLKLLTDYFLSEPRIDRIATRAKTVLSFVEKAQKQIDGVPVYSDPLNQIQDQIGSRIITFYRSDVERVAALVLKYFRPIEDQLIVPDRDSEFGYFGRHFVLFCPSDVLDPENDRDDAPKVFELQIKTLYQHAWSEANHDLGYKESAALTSEEKRRVAFTAAQSWGADTIFEELFKEKSNTTVASDA